MNVLTDGDVFVCDKTTAMRCVTLSPLIKNKHEFTIVTIALRCKTIDEHKITVITPQCYRSMCGNQSAKKTL